MERGPVFKQHTIQRLRHIFDSRSKSVAAIEKEMGKSRGYLGDAFRGEKRLSFETILEILDHLEIDPAEFFRGPTEEERRRLAYPEAPAEQDAVAEGADLDARADTRSLMLALIRVLEAKGVLDQDEIRSVLAEGESG